LFPSIPLRGESPNYAEVGPQGTEDRASDHEPDHPQSIDDHGDEARREDGHGEEIR
jgi:hypothetical protein